MERCWVRPRRQHGPSTKARVAPLAWRGSASPGLEWGTASDSPCPGRQVPAAVPVPVAFNGRRRGDWKQLLSPSPPAHGAPEGSANPGLAASHRQGPWGGGCARLSSSLHTPTLLPLIPLPQSHRPQPTGAPPSPPQHPHPSASHLAGGTGQPGQGLGAGQGGQRSPPP